MASATFDVTVIGAGLAGCEAAWQLAEAGLRVRLCEQKPQMRTPAQVSDKFAELVCSNSLRSRNVNNAVGLLKEEMYRLGSLVMRAALQAQVAAGDALAVDRVIFGDAMTQAMHEHPNITVVAGRVDGLPPASDGPCIVATGPLTADALAAQLAQATGSAGLYFYDAIAPIVAGDSLLRDEMFAASRWDKGDGADYWNCPLDKPAYDALIEHLCTAETMPAHAFEKPRYFPGCQPMEVIAKQGHDALRFGPMKPVGLTWPKTGRWPHAVVQLRAEDGAGQAYNLVGLQTKLKYGPQKEMMKLIPGLQQAEILRYGALHRNTYVDAPEHLDASMRLKALPHIRLAGQITGVEGYVESAASGLTVALLFLLERAQTLQELPAETALGSLWRHVRGVLRLPGRPHEPQNINWALFPAVAPRGKKRDKAQLKAERVDAARASLQQWATATGRPLLPQLDLPASRSAVA